MYEDDDLDPLRAPMRGPQPRTLALDVGSVRVGVAISCPFGSFAQPLEVVPRKGDAVGRIVALAAEHEAACVVVGRPLRLNGEVGPAVLAIEKFVAELAPKLPCPVAWWDERLTTRAAERDMIALGARRSERRGNIDKVAAALILQAYLDSRAHMP